MNKRQIIQGVIDELNGKVFQDSTPINTKSKAFYEDRYLKIINLLPPINPNQKILEAGIHSGMLSLSLKRIYSLKKQDALEHPTTFDKYQKTHLEMMEKNQIYIKPVDLYNRIYPWKADYFDLIVFSEVLEHLIPAHVPHILENFYRILNKNGVLVVTTPNIASLLKRLNLMRGKNPVEFDLNFHDGATYGHIREYTADEIKNTIERAGLKVTFQKYFCIDSNRNIYTRLEEASSRIVPQFGNDIYTQARKSG